jgi:hypothetical protein
MTANTRKWYLNAQGAACRTIELSGYAGAMLKSM